MDMLTVHTNKNVKVSHLYDVRLKKNNPLILEKFTKFKFKPALENYV